MISNNIDNALGLDNISNEEAEAVLKKLWYTNDKWYRLYNSKLIYKKEENYVNFFFFLI